jgi:hypothetical protein
MFARKDQRTYMPASTRTFILALLVHVGLRYYRHCLAAVLLLLLVQLLLLGLLVLLLPLLLPAPCLPNLLSAHFGWPHYIKGACRNQRR